MSTFIHADIFFFITSIVVVVFGVVGLVALVYIVRMLRDIRYIVGKVRAESDHVSEDIAEIRGRIKEGRVGFGSVARTFFTFFAKKSSSRRGRKTAEPKE